MADGTKKPAFIGQALMLLVPVIVLLAIGLNSLSQDKIQAHREAAERAQQLADSLAARAIAMFSSPNGERHPGTDYLFQVGASGELLFPPPIAPLSPRPLHLAKLTQEQAELWRTAQESEAQTNRFAQAIAAYTKFLALNPPTEFAANATYSLGLLYSAQTDFAEAVGDFRKLIEQHTDALAESGMPLKPLAMLKLLDLQSRLPQPDRAVSLDSVCSNLVYHPTPLSRALLRQAGQSASASAEYSVFNRWMDVWSTHEKIRGLYAAALHSMADVSVSKVSESITKAEDSNLAANSKPSAFAADRVFWFAEPPGNLKSKLDERQLSQNWLAVPRQKSSTDRWFACLPETQTQSTARALVDQTGTVADYLGVEVTLAGKAMATSAGYAPKEEKKELLGSAIRPEVGNGWVEAKV